MMDRQDEPPTIGRISSSDRRLSLSIGGRPSSYRLRFKRGSVPDGDKRGSAHNDWRHRVKRAGVVLDHAPGPEQLNLCGMSPRADSFRTIVRYRLGRRCRGVGARTRRAAPTSHRGAALSERSRLRVAGRTRRAATGSPAGVPRLAHSRAVHSAVRLASRRSVEACRPSSEWAERRRPSVGDDRG